MELEEIKDNARKRVRILKMRKTNGTHKTIAAFDLCYDNAIMEVVVAEWSKLYGAERREATNEQPNV